jgi:hypothetical protein
MPASPRLVRPWPPGVMTSKAGRFRRRETPDPDHAGKLTAADLNSYNYLRQVVMSFTGNADLVLKSTILGHRSAVSEEKGQVASLNADGLALYSAFTQELRQTMQL